MLNLIRACMMAAFAFGLAFAASVVAGDTTAAQSRTAQRRCPVGENPLQNQRGVWVCCPPQHAVNIYGNCVDQRPSTSSAHSTYRGHGSCSDWSRNDVIDDDDDEFSTDPCDHDEPRVHDGGNGYERGIGYDSFMGPTGDAGPSFWEWLLWRSRD